MCIEENSIMTKWLMFKPKIDVNVILTRMSNIIWTEWSTIHPFLFVITVFTFSTKISNISTMSISNNHAISQQNTTTSQLYIVIIVVVILIADSLWRSTKTIWVAIVMDQWISISIRRIPWVVVVIRNFLRRRMIRWNSVVFVETSQIRHWIRQREMMIANRIRCFVSWQ